MRRWEKETLQETVEGVEEAGREEMQETSPMLLLCAQPVDSTRRRQSVAQHDRVGHLTASSWTRNGIVIARASK